MIRLSKRTEVELFISGLDKNSTIGFVPTMGALHAGHISLVEKSVQENDITIVSIFVNPTQFNNTEDLLHYPRTVSEDIAMLESTACSLVFIPEYEEIYPEGDTISESYDFGDLESVMEGVFRPGHFNGVAIVVRRLFEITQPHRAYFGLKDFQQLAIIKALVAQLSLPIQIISCDIVREADGLAMSSRNVRLLPEERKQAAKISQILCAAQSLSQSKSVEEVKKFVINSINTVPLLSIEYFDIVDSASLCSISHWTDTQEPVGCIAVHVGKVRLIDAIMFF